MAINSGVNAVLLPKAAQIFSRRPVPPAGPLCKHDAPVLLGTTCGTAGAQQLRYLVPVRLGAKPGQPQKKTLTREQIVGNEIRETEFKIQDIRN